MLARKRIRLGVGAILAALCACVLRSIPESELDLRACDAALRTTSNAEAAPSDSRCGDGIAREACADPRGWIHQFLCRGAPSSIGTDALGREAASIDGVEIAERVDLDTAVCDA